MHRGLAIVPSHSWSSWATPITVLRLKVKSSLLGFFFFNQLTYNDWKWLNIDFITCKMRQTPKYFCPNGNRTVSWLYMKRYSYILSFLFRNWALISDHLAKLKIMIPACCLWLFYLSILYEQPKMEYCFISLRVKTSNFWQTFSLRNLVILFIDSWFVSNNLFHLLLGKIRLLN